MKTLINLQRKTAELTDDIKDILHASNINFQALLVQIRINPTLVQQFYYLQQLLTNVKKQIDNREHLYMSYLITKQIQEQEKRVRRERISQYEQKIYDQRRIIADKQGFYQSLLRPKKKKMASQTVEQFQEMRAKQKEAEQKKKLEQLLKELQNIQAFRIRLDDNYKNRHNKYKLFVSERSKLHSISNVNSTGLSQLQFVTQKIIPLQQKNYQNNPSLIRSSSLQQSICEHTKPNLIQQQQNISQQIIPKLLEDIVKFNNQNAELNQIYDQQLLLFNFKKDKFNKNKQKYNKLNENIDNTRVLYDRLKKQEQWRYRVCNEPIKINQKRSSSATKMKKQNGLEMKINFQ